MKNTGLILLVSSISLSAFATDVVPGSKPQGRGLNNAVNRPARVSRIRNPQARASERLPQDASVNQTRNQVRDPQVNHQSRVMPQGSEVSHPAIIYKFSGVTTASQRQSLETQLRNINSELRIAKSEDILNRSSSCASSDAVCVIVSQKSKADFQRSEAALPSHSSVGMIAGLTRAPKPSAYTRQLKNPNQNSGNASSRNSGVMFEPSYGSNTFSYDNPNPNFYYIPDLSSQYAGAYFPNMSSLISATTMITHVSANVNIYHTYHRDLKIYLGYDDGVNDYYEVKSDRVSHSAGYYTYQFSSDYFDALSPHGAFFYVDAYDMQSQDDGFINYIDFQVDWIDYANLTFYGGTALNNKAVTSQRFLSVNSAVYNNSDVDINNMFSLGWYAELDTSASGNCSTLSYNPASANVWLVGYADFTDMPYNSYSNAYLSNVDLDLVAANSSGYYMNTGKYCLWSYVDDLDEVFEWDETAEIPASVVAWDNITNLGGFQYTYQSYKPDLTFNYASSANKFIPSANLNATAVIYNDSITASPFNGGFIGWYFTALPNGLTCSSPSLVLDVNTAYFAGAKSLPAVGARASVSIAAPATSLSAAQNPSGGYMVNGQKYCLWAWVDDYNTVDEGNEDNNAMVYTNTYTHTNVTTGVKNNTNELALSVYPNPAVSFVRIDIPTSISNKDLTVEISSLNGAVVSTQQTRGSQVELQVSDLASGLYFITVRTEDGETGVQKFLKQ